MGRGGALHPQGQEGGRGVTPDLGRGCAPCGVCGIWGTPGHSGAEPWGKERYSSVEGLVLKSRRWAETWGLKPVVDLFAFWLVLENLALFEVGRGPYPHV